MIDKKYKYEVIFLVDSFKNYNYFSTLADAMKFARKKDTIKILKGKKVVKEFKNG